MNKKITPRGWLIFSLAVNYIFLLITSAIWNITEYPFDAEYYWSIAEPILDNGKINFLLFPDTFRGYLFPTMVVLLKHIFPGAWGWRLLGMALVTVEFTVFVPYILRRHVVKNFADVVKSFISIMVFLLIWGNYVQYPLSDLVASSFVSGGVALLIWITDSKNKRLIWQVIKAFIAGMLFYASYNTRVGFFIGIAFAVLLFCILMRKQLKKLLILLMAMLLGAMLIAMPQCMINRKYHADFSPKVYTQLVEYEENLQLLQVFWGISFSKYETYVGDLELYSSNGVFFEDPIGSEILKRENIQSNQFEYSDVIKLLIKYPLDMVGIYIRHLVVLMTPTFSEVYITNIYFNKGIFVLVSILIWLIAVVNIYRTIKEIQWKKIMWLFTLVLPSVLQLAGAPELRFFIPIYLLLYVYVVQLVDYKALFLYCKEHWFVISTLALIIICLWLTILGDVLSFNRERKLIINDRVPTIEHLQNSN